MILITEKYWFELRTVDVLGNKEKWLMRRVMVWFLFVPVYTHIEIISRQ
jgi:hypothetical protein